MNKRDNLTLTNAICQVTAQNNTISPQLSEAVARWCSVKKVFLEISQNSRENTCARVSFLIKLQKKRLCHSCFPVNSAELLRTPFFIEYLWWLLLQVETFFTMNNMNKMNKRQSTQHYFSKNVSSKERVKP